MSNRFELVEREIVFGHIEGVDFGPDLYCIARSPAAVLVWSPGAPYTSGRQSVYGPSHLLGLPDRTPRFTYHPTWKHIGPLGGRLRYDRILAHADQIGTLFSGEPDPEIVKEIAEAVRVRKTLLIETGGPALMPARKLGASAYAAWRDLPYRGFVVPEEKRL